MVPLGQAAVVEVEAEAALPLPEGRGHSSNMIKSFPFSFFRFVSLIFLSLQYLDIISTLSYAIHTSTAPDLLDLLLHLRFLDSDAWPKKAWQMPGTRLSSSDL